MASYNLGCFCGSILCFFVGDLLGRRKTIFLGSTIVVIGAILQSSAFHLAHLIVGRVITGIGNGLNTSTIPIWQSECSNSHVRGPLVMFTGSLITGGICISYWLDFGFSFLDPSSISWRFPIAFQIFFALVILCFILLLPESPRWLILRGRNDEAKSVLVALLGLPVDDPSVLHELATIKSTISETRQAGWHDLLTMGEDRHLHRIVLAYINQMFQQISGINLITYYAATIYQNHIGLSGFLSRILAACNGTEYFIASLLPVFICEKVGRRPLMLIGAAGMSFSMIILAITTSHVGQTGPGIAAAIFMFVFNTFFAWGWLGMTWLYPAEIVRKENIHLVSGELESDQSNCRNTGSATYPCPGKRVINLCELDFQLLGSYGHARFL